MGPEVAAPVEGLATVVVLLVVGAAGFVLAGWPVVADVPAADGCFVPLLAVAVAPGTVPAGGTVLTPGGLVVGGTMLDGVAVAPGPGDAPDELAGVAAGDPVVGNVREGDGVGEPVDTARDAADDFLSPPPKGQTPQIVVIPVAIPAKRVTNAPNLASRGHGWEGLDASDDADSIFVLDGSSFCSMAGSSCRSGPRRSA